MEIKIGSIVRSKAGRDKGRLFLVVDIKDGYIYVSDGKLRRVESPKKKKLKHLQGTNFITEKDFSENFRVRSILTESRKTV